ncbi:G-protein coupled receptor GRL101-like [Argopecten irradians]|uniref:G-protein coupled receptor GRL101-like n=1 Tax=Argopecten irradians TaxID=31199 RepID=UPI00371D3277
MPYLISRNTILIILISLMIIPCHTVDTNEGSVLQSDEHDKSRDFNGISSFVEDGVDKEKMEMRKKRQILDKCIDTSEQETGITTCPLGTSLYPDRFDCCIDCPRNGTGSDCELSSCNVVLTCSSAFYGAPSSLELGKSKIRFLSEDVFHGLSGIMSLNLYENTITALPEYVFRDLYQLRLLDLGTNNITDLPPKVFKGLGYLGYLDLSKNNIASLHSTIFYDLVELRTLFLQHNKLAVIQHNVFSRLSKLTELHLQNNVIMVLHESTFICMAIDLDGQSQGTLTNETLLQTTMILQNLQQLDLSHNQLKHLPKLPSSLTDLSIVGNKIEVQEKMFENLNSLGTLHTDTPFMCCVKPASVDDGNCFETNLPLWECTFKPEKCKPKGDPLSSCSALVRSSVLRVCLWIIGMCALIGNLFVIIYRLFLDRDTLTKNYSLFTLNLALSDLLMGIYLLIIGIFDAYYNGVYAWNDHIWRTSILCATAGVLASVSSEMSTFVILMVTLDRLIVIMFPLSRLSKFNITWKHALVVSLSLWVVAITLAVIPVFAVQSYFKGKFYSQSGVCLALPLTADEIPGTGYSFAIFVCLNSIFFAVVFAGQICIFVSLKRSGRRMASTQNRQREMTVAVTLFFVVMSDFCCWFPIGIMGVLSRCGIRIPSDVYAWVMVFVLPINAAINPLLYTGTAVWRIRRKFQSKCTRDHTIQCVSVHPLPFRTFLVARALAIRNTPQVTVFDPISTQ